MSDRAINTERRFRCIAVALAAAAMLSACSTIPSSGPTGSQVSSQIISGNGTLPIALVPVRTIADVPQSSSLAPVFSDTYIPAPPTELVGPGDVLSIAIYETGISVFGRGGAAPAGETGGGVDTASRAERFAAVRVDDGGTISLPFVGELAIAGRTTSEVERIVRNAYRGKSQNPQVLVSIVEGLTNSVIIGGDIRNPGRLVLPTNRETLSDVVALAGGNTGEIKDMLVRIQRNGVFGEFRLSDILANPAQDVRIFPSDRIQLVRAPQSFSVLGAAGRSDQIAFPGPGISLVEAIAAAGGANPNAGDPRAIFLFRFVKQPDGTETPTAYHFNMMEASSYLLAQRFAMKDKDVLYVGNAEANQPSKMVQIVSQLFFPLATLDNVINR